MIPTDWMPHERHDDGELLGYLAPAGDGMFTPRTIFGLALDGPAEQADAERRLEEVGLACLADRWLLDVDGRAEPVAVQIVEAAPDRLVVSHVDSGDPDNYGTRYTLDVPVDASLRRG